MSVLFSIFTLLSVSTALAETVTDDHRPATLPELRSMVKVQGCSGALVSLGRDRSAPAAVLAAGHCASYPDFFNPGEAGSGLDLTKEAPVLAFPPSASLFKPLKISLSGLHYGTMTGVDVSIYDLSVSVRALAARKLTTLTLADHLPRAGDLLAITSGFFRETETCEVESIIADTPAEQELFGKDSDLHTFRNSILFKKPCYARTGWSGGPVYDPTTKLVYGVISRLYDTSPDVPLSRFAQFVGPKWDPFNPETPGDVRVVASNVLDLRDCLSKHGKFDAKKAGCSLPAPVTPPVPSAPRSR